jgi:hypothetical protein
VIIKRIVHAICLLFFLVPAALAGQATDVKRILSDIRAALGGDQKLAAVKTVSIEGQASRIATDGSQPMARDLAIAIDLSGPQPKYEKREVVANLGGNTISRRSGFDGAQPIDEIDAPPEMSGGGGGMRLVRMGPNGPVGSDASPEQLAELRKTQLQNARREFARLAVVLFAASTPAYPVEFAYAGQADGAGGKTDVLEVKSTDGFTCKVFVDAKTRLPIMVSWMDREPVTRGGGPRVVTSDSADAAAQSHEEVLARMREAEARRRTVEFRALYSDFKTIDGIKIPTRIVHMIDGVQTEEMRWERVRVK